MKKAIYFLLGFTIATILIKKDKPTVKKVSQDDLEYMRKIALDEVSNKVCDSLISGIKECNSSVSVK